LQDDALEIQKANIHFQDPSREHYLNLRLAHGNVVDTPACTYAIIEFSEEHLPLFVKLLVMGAMIHAWCAWMLVASSKKGTLPKHAAARNLRSSFLVDGSFEDYVKAHLPETQWIYALSVHSELRTKIATMAMTHVKVWQHMRAEYPEHAHMFAKPWTWVLDFVPLFGEIWNRSDARNRPTKQKDINLYKPLFRKENYGEKALALAQQLEDDSGCGAVYLLPDGRVAFQLYSEKDKHL
jgi:hypothetical protein